MIARRNQERVISLGKGEVESSILSRSTRNPTKAAVSGTIRADGAHPDAERRKNTHVRVVENPWSTFHRCSAESPDDIAHGSTAHLRHPYEVA